MAETTPEKKKRVRKPKVPKPNGAAPLPSQSTAPTQDEAKRIAGLAHAGGAGEPAKQYENSLAAIPADASRELVIEAAIVAMPPEWRTAELVTVLRALDMAFARKLLALFAAFWHRGYVLGAFDGAKAVQEAAQKKATGA